MTQEKEFRKDVSRHQQLLKKRLQRTRLKIVLPYNLTEEQNKRVISREIIIIQNYIYDLKKHIKTLEGDL